MACPLTRERQSFESLPVEIDTMLATVVFTDVVGSTARLVELGDRRWRDVLDRHDDIARREVARFGGRAWKTTGDGVLATFDAPSRAIRCVQSLRDALRTLGLEMRAGMHAGQIALRDGDITGVAVHIAAHVLDAACDGGVLVSRTVAELVEGSGLDLVDMGAHVLKGVPGELNLFLVR